MQIKSFGVILLCLFVFVARTGQGEGEANQQRQIAQAIEALDNRLWENRKQADQYLRNHGPEALKPLLSCFYKASLSQEFQIRARRIVGAWLRTKDKKFRANLVQALTQMDEGNRLRDDKKGWIVSYLNRIDSDYAEKQFTKQGATLSRKYSYRLGRMARILTIPHDWKGKANTLRYLAHLKIDAVRIQRIRMEGITFERLLQINYPLLRIDLYGTQIPAKLQAKLREAWPNANLDIRDCGFLGVILSGAEISKLLPKGPAQKAGLQVGDTVVKVGNTNVASAQEIVNAVGSYKSNAEVTLLVRRPGQEELLRVRTMLGDWGKTKIFPIEQLP